MSDYLSLEMYWCFVYDAEQPILLWRLTEEIELVALVQKSPSIQVEELEPGGDWCV